MTEPVTPMEVPAEGRPSPRRRLVVTAGLLLLAVIAGAVLALLRTEAGQRFVLDTVLGQVSGSLAGELRIAGIRSPTLLAGATLQGVELDDAEGRRVFSADSIVVRYLPQGLLAATPRLRSMIVWGLDLEIATLSADDSLNLKKIAAPRSEGPDSARSLTRILAGQVGVRGGRVSVLSPAGEDREATIVPGPRGPLTRLGLDEIELDLEDVVLSVGEETTLEAALAGLAMDVRLPTAEQPLQLRDAFGRVGYGPEGITLDDGSFRLPGTTASGSLGLGPPEPGAPWSLRGDVEVADWGALEDLRWIDPRFPEGQFRGAVAIETGTVTDLSFTRLDVRLPESQLTVTGDLSIGEVWRARDLHLTANPLQVDRLEPWTGRESPVDGWVSGQATLSGTLEDLVVDGRLTLVPARPGSRPTTAEISGRAHLGDDPGGTGLEIRLAPLDYGLVREFLADAAIQGTGTASVRIDGRVRNGLGVVAEASHTPPSGESPTRIFTRGTLSRSDARGWVVDLSGDVAPLSLITLEAFLSPGTGLTGELRGEVRAAGPLDALEVAGDFAGEYGAVTLGATVDLFAPSSAYRLEVEADSLDLGHFTTRVPSPTSWSGGLSVEGSGLVLDSLSGRVAFTAVDSRVGRLAMDTLVASAQAENGFLLIDSLSATVGGARLRGSGRLGMRSGREGEATLTLRSEDLLGLRPMFMGDSLIVRDELTPLREEFLRVEGVDIESLPSAAEARMAGALDVTVDFSGRLRDLDVRLDLSLVGGAYGESAVDSLTVGLVAEGLPSLSGRWDGDISATGIEWEGRRFVSATFSGGMMDRVGAGSLQIDRRVDESLFVSGEVAVDSLGGTVALEEAAVTRGEQMWDLVRPAEIRWSASSVSIDEVEVRREGDDPMSLTARGTLSNTGDSDFTLLVRGLHLEEVGAVLDEDGEEIGGHTDLDVRVTGPARDPRIDASLEILDPLFRGIRLDRVSATLEYGERSVSVSLEAWDGERRALTGSGRIPVDLALSDVPVRLLDEPLEATIAADSIDAAVALAYLGALQDVEGMVSADLRIAGTTRDPVPTGTVRLADAAWTIEGLGVRHRSVAGSLDLSADRTVAVDLSARGGGSSTVTGTVGLETLSDPELALDVRFDRFRAIDRRDIQGIVSGGFSLTGSYQRPLAEGAVTVDEGTIQVDEFSRAAGVVDLTDPRLLGQGFAVDTTVFVSQPILAEVRNPFLDNLRLDVDLSVPRNTWIRSGDMDVEMGGELLVRYDRSAGDLVLIGELEALRGTYRVLGRTFDVQEGTVAFIGRPGVNPTLDITAASRVRSAEGDPIDILARVEGTLVQPRVTLSSEEGELSQSDLISYLIFNRSAAELGRSQQSALGNNLNNGALSSAVTGGITYVTGALLSQGGQALQQISGLDYLTISSGPGTAEGASISSTQLEAGRYLSDELFVVLVFRPLAGQEVDRFGGVRLEWALTSRLSLEAFIEDRFLRGGSGVFGVQDLGSDQLYGILIFREWGYND